MSDVALLVLEDGTVFQGRAWGTRGRTLGEIVFSTAMTGYQETLTDPSYHRQIVVMTAPPRRQHRRQRRGYRVLEDLGRGLRGPRPRQAGLQLESPA